MENIQSITIRIAGFNGSSFSLFEGCDSNELQSIDQDATQAEYERQVSETLTRWADEGVTVEYTYLTADQNIIAETGGYDAVTKWMDEYETVGGLTLEQINRAEFDVWNAGTFWVETPNMGAAYDAWSETHNGTEKWSDEDRANWISSATADGFDAEQAGAFYDHVKTETLSGLPE